MRSSSSWSLIYGLGMLLVFGGERLAGGGGARTIATSAGVLLILAAIAVRVLRMRSTEGDAQRVERILLGLYALGAGALVLYFLQSDLTSGLLGKPLEQSSPKLQVALECLWPALWLGAAVPITLVEMAFASVARAPRLEAGRIKDAMLTGLGLAGALVFAFSATYVATQRDKKMDLSYFRTTRPGEATRKIVRGLDQPITVSLFFPPANEVREEVAGYFDDLKKESSQLTVESFDYAVDPIKAKTLSVSGNGIVVIARGQRREQLSIGTEMDQARSMLRALDKEVQKRLLQVGRPGRTVYLTTGHGERAPDPASETDKRATIRDLRELMQNQGYQVRTLGAADGLASEVPGDAAVVLTIGPTQTLLPEEVGALKRYIDKGGRMLLALDPEPGLEFKELLEPLGVKFTPTLLCNQDVFARKTFQLSDRANIATASFSSHPSVTTIGRLGGRAPMILVGAGHLDELKGQHAAEIGVDFSVHAHPATWSDLNGNYQFDPPAEAKKAWDLAAAISKKQKLPADGKEPKDKGASTDGRVIVLADSDAVSDGVVGNPGNAYFVLDGLKWLLGDEAIAGEVSTETDVPIAHTRKQDVAWFYSSIFVVPALVIGAGVMVTRRRRTSTRARVAGKEARS